MSAKKRPYSQRAAETAIETGKTCCDRFKFAKMCQIQQTWPHPIHVQKSAVHAVYVFRNRTEKEFVFPIRLSLDFEK